MTLFSFIALALGMAATTADRVPRPAAALIAVARASRASLRPEGRTAVRSASRGVRKVRVRRDHRPLRRFAPPLRGGIAARAPGLSC